MKHLIDVIVHSHVCSFEIFAGCVDYIFAVFFWVFESPCNEADRFFPAWQSSRVRCIRCSNSEAEVDCFSCSRFYGAGGGKFCGRCFETCHPFYRVKHKWALLEDVDQQTYRTSLERNIADIRGLLDVASTWEKELYTQDNDTKVGQCNLGALFSICMPPRHSPTINRFYWDTQGSSKTSYPFHIAFPPCL